MLVKKNKLGGSKKKILILKNGGLSSMNVNAVVKFKPHTESRLASHKIDKLWVWIIFLAYLHAYIRFLESEIVSSS